MLGISAGLVGGGWMGLEVPGAGAQVGFEVFLQGFSTSVDERFSGREGASEDGGDFLVGEVLVAAEDHGETLVMGEGVECFLDSGLEF